MGNKVVIHPSHPLYGFYSRFPRFLGEDKEIRTADENGMPHSFNDKPALVNNVSRYWYKHGELHREGDKPALESFVGVNVKQYYREGKLHRDNGKPASIYAMSVFFGYFRTVHAEDWKVLGIFHNTLGPATYGRADGLASSFKWFLYGLEVSKEGFEQITAYASKVNVPVWVALFKVIEIIDEETIRQFQDETGNWNPELPLEWLFRMWNVAENEALNHALKVIIYEETKNEERKVINA